MRNFWGRLLTSTTMLGAGIMLTACVPQAQPAQTPAAPVTVTVAPASQPQEQSKPAKRAGETSPSAGETRSIPRFDPSVFVTTYDPLDTQKLQVAQRPGEFIPSSITGEGPAEVHYMDMHWARWDRQEARGNAIVRVTGGGGPPEVIKNVRIVFSNVRYLDGKLQYTHYHAEFPDGNVNDRDLEFHPA